MSDYFDNLVREWNFRQAMTLNDGDLVTHRTFSTQSVNRSIWMVLESWMTTDGQYVKMLNLTTFHTTINPSDILMVSVPPPPGRIF